MSTTELHDERDLEWLAARRPRGIALDETTTLRARAAMFEETPPPRSPRRRRGLLRLASGALAAGGIAVAVVLTTGGADVTISHRGGVPEAAAAPLARLANHLHARARAAAPPTGDATLIIRHQSYPDRGSIDGADLYADDGTYYYSETPAGLPAAIAAEKADTNTQDDWTFIRRDLAAAEAAFKGPIDQARERMGNAAFPNGAPPAKTVDASTGAQETLQQKQRAAAAKGQPTDVKPTTPEQQLENRIWDNSMDALSAGAGRPAVRAGVLHLLATVGSVTVTKASDGGRDVLVLTCALPVGGHYAESLTVDASSGMPIRFVGGREGKAPSVTITYNVSRVTVADIAHGG